MGGAMSRRLLSAGYRVAGTARTRRHAADLMSVGLRWRDTPRAVAIGAEVVFTSIPDDAALNAVASGPDGVLAGLGERAIWVDMSTVSPSASTDLAERVRKQGAAMLDAPVSGSVPQAQEGGLTIMVGGGDEAYARVEPILRVLGTPTHVGANGRGLALKLAINISLGVQMLAFAEGVVLAERAGVDPKLALEVMTRSAIASPMLKARSQIVFDLPVDAWFDLALMQKDLELALSVGRELGVRLPTADRANEFLSMARTLGYDHDDIAVLVQVLEQLAARPEAA
jgi:3-hydroxyisobutyrate dehydrogenase-like beta-hydroxyacid dehydrogenase